MKTNHFVIPAELARSEALADVRPSTTTPLRAVALKLTKRGAMAAKAELANAALLAFVEVLFDVDEDQNYANIDVDGRILLPTPWGRNGSMHWGLRRSEQRALSWLLRKRAETEENPLFVYDSEVRSWYVGRRYTRRSALAYLKAFPVTVSEWRTAWRATGSTWSAQRLSNE